MLRAFVERHDDVGAEANLRFHGTLGTEEMRRAIEMRTKRDALFLDLAQFVQAEDLKAAGVGKDGARPRHEAMQPTHAADGVDSGAKVEVVRIAENDLRR